MTDNSQINNTCLTLDHTYLYLHILHIFLCKKRWQEYTELYKKDPNNPDNHDGVITHLEPDILECEVKWVLGSITMNKASGGDGIPVELLQIIKDDAVKVPANLEDSAVGTGLEKVSFNSSSKENQSQGMFKLLHSSHKLGK